jgi:hypothetical protein
VIGREIDLIIANSDTELSSNEWKKEFTTLTTTIEQQCEKNLRTKCVILNNILSLPIEDTEKVYVLGMYWIGKIYACYYVLASVFEVLCFRIRWMFISNKQREWCVYYTLRW